MVSAGHRRALCSLALIATIIVSGVRVGAAEWVQQDKLLASDPAQGDWFGLPVAMSGNTAVIGANGDDDNGAQSGSAYVFHNPGSGWQQVTKLSPLDASPAWMFSDSLAIDGNRVIAGTRHGEAAYIFEDSGGGWHQVAKLTGVGTESRFGDSVAIRGNTAVVGAWGDEGAAYVFEDDGTGWDRVARLTSPDAAAGAQFGWSVAVGDNVVMVGASGDFGHPASTPGSVYVFQRNGSAWTCVDELTAAETHFGCSLSISGNRTIVGTLEECAYIFDNSGTGWTQVARLTASDGEAQDRFGWTVSLDGDRAVVGAFNDGGLVGSAYVFETTGAAWDEVARLTAADAMAGDYFGYSVAVSGSTVLVGAQGKDGCFDAMGSAYVFGRVPPHTLPGDANHDGKVDGGDLAVWQQNYDPLGVGNNTCEMGDFNENGRIDGGDLAIWQQNYDPLGTGGGVIPDPGIKAAVPEPTTLSLLSAIALLLFRPSLRRR